MYIQSHMFGGYGDYSPFFFGGIGFLALWDMVWKGLAMWRAGRRNEPWWFLALMVVNSMGILPIAYLLIWGKEVEKTKVITKVVRVVKKKKKS